MNDFRKNLLAGAAAAVFMCAAPLFAQNAAEAVIKNIMGSVKVYSSIDRKADINKVDTWRDAQVSQTVRTKDMIATAAEAEVRLEMADGSTVRLRENTTLEVGSLKGAEIKLRLADGSIVATAKKLVGGGSRTFEISTPTSLAAIRGTTLEVDSRKSSKTTTVKTFDGSVAVAPTGSKKYSEVGHYQLTEVAPGDGIASVRGIPSYYKPKSTNILSEEDMAAITGFKRAILTYDELFEMAQQLEKDGIPASVGIGESDDEGIARTVSADEARKQLAVNMSTQVQRLSESYSQNVDGQAKTIWEEGVRQFTDVGVRGTTVHTTITQWRKSDGRFRVYSLMVMDPNRLKNSLSHTAGKLDDEHGMRAKKDDMMSKMDAAIKAYNTRYHDR